MGSNNKKESQNKAIGKDNKKSKTKLIPPFLMLLAGVITIITTFVMRYNIKSMLVILLIVFIVFYIFGLIIKRIMDSFTIIEEEAVSEDGEVIEKEAEDAESTPQEPEKESRL